MDKIIKFSELKELRKKFRDKKIVQCHGVFDLLHFGHLAHFKSAKKHGDLLVVTITPDVHVNKGPGRPYFGQDKRLLMLAELESIDFVCLNDHPRAVEAILELKPDFYVKGPDYIDKAKDVTGAIHDEEAAVESGGGKIVFTEDETESSSHLINRFLTNWNDTQKKALDEIRNQFGVEGVINCVETLQGMKALVVGEPIIDTYIFCKGESLSSKSPTVSVSYLYHEDYAGGSLAIANQLAEFGVEVDLLITHAEEPLLQKLLTETTHPGVKIHSHIVKDVPTPQKKRYLAAFQSHKMFELQYVSSNQWVKNDPAKFVEQLLSISKNKDISVIADFGHGLFEKSVLSSVKDINSFVALNVQTNSGNFGFNPFTKHPRYDYLSIDERECRIALQDRFSPIRDLAKEVVHYFDSRPTSITLGAEGALYYDEMEDVHYCPTFFSDVVDTTGAGDAYFSLSSALVKLESPPMLIPFLGNICAGLKAGIIGNKKTVSKVGLIKAINAILK